MGSTRSEAASSAVSVTACAAEFLAMLLFVVFGCGSAMGIAGSTQDSSGEGGTTSVLPGWVLMVSLVFGLAITSLVYAIGHYSGGHINCAVTFGLVLAGKCSVPQGLANFAAQMFGSVTGALILCAIFPLANDQTSSLGANSVGAAWMWYNALIGEIMGTFLLMFVVLESAVHKMTAANRSLAPLAIGLAVFIAHAVLIPIDGCSINPTRSFGPALIAQIRFGLVGPPPKPTLPPTDSALEPGVTTQAPTAVVAPPTPFADMWIFWIGPLAGAALAVGAYNLLRAIPPRDKDGEEESQLTNEA